MLACDPAWGCTLACSAPNNFLARSRARFSTTSAVLAAAVVTLAGISLGILVREYRAGGLEHRFADKIFRGDQFQALVLAAGFVVDGGGNLADRIHTAGGTFCVTAEFFIFFPGCSYTSGSMPFHISLRRLYRGKAKLRIKPVRIAGQENPAPQILQRGMLHDAFHHPLAQTAPAMCFQHKNIAQIRHCCEVADHPGKSNLLAAPFVNAKTQRVLNRPRHDFTRNSFCPIAIGQKP